MCTHSKPPTSLASTRTPSYQLVQRRLERVQGSQPELVLGSLLGPEPASQLGPELGFQLERELASLLGPEPGFQLEPQLGLASR